MQGKSIKRRLIWLAVEVAAVLALSSVLLRWAAQANVARAMLSGGPHTPTSVLLLTGGMLLARLIAIVCLPAVVVQTLAIIIFERWWDKRSSAETGGLTRQVSQPASPDC
jgi:uncharacterized membrane protein